MTQHEKGKTQATRGNQEIGRHCDDSYSIKGIQETSGGNGDFNVGTGRTNRTRQDSPLNILLGGIVERLLENQKQKLKETRECVEWYQREEKIIQAEIEKLEQLQVIALSSDLTESLTNQSESSEEE